MNYIKIDTEDVCNGDGLRVVLWLSGCSHRCYNCQNPQTWDVDSGILFDESAEEELLRELNKDYISGLTLTGGDPLHKTNLDGVLNLVNKIRLLFGDTKTLWIYSGYTFEEIFHPAITDDLNLERDELLQKRKDIVSLCDVLVDGIYIDELRDVSLSWRGSSNQRVIDVKKSIIENKIVLYCD